MQNEYLIEKGKVENSDDLIGNFLLRLINLHQATNQGMNGLNDKQQGRHQEILKSLEKGIEHKQATGELLSKIKKSIDTKEVDLSEVLDVLSKISSSNSALGEVLGQLKAQHPELLSNIGELGNILRQNKPDNKDIVDSQGKLAEKIGKLLIDLTKEVKSKEFPKEIKVSNSLEVKKPVWWKEFTFSWTPLEKLIEKLKSHTFSVKVENQTNQKLIDSDDIAKKIGNVITKNIPKFKSGLGAFPFNADENGSVKVATGDESFKTRFEYDANNNPIYIGNAEPNSEESAEVWQIRKFTYDENNNLLSIDWADGDRKFDNIWENRASLNYK